jgi:hypothetical protein
MTAVALRLAQKVHCVLSVQDTVAMVSAQKCEALMLEVLEWRLLPVTPCDFMVQKVMVCRRSKSTCVPAFLQFASLWVWMLPLRCLLGAELVLFMVRLILELQHSMVREGGVELIPT